LRKNNIKRLLIALSCILLFGGCSPLPAAQTTFSVLDKPEEAKPIDARDLLQDAIQTMTADDPTQQFWYKGYVANSIEKRKTTSMYEGIVVRPIEAYIVNGRMAGKPFQYYRWDGHFYINKGDTWFRADQDEALPYDPLAGFTDWLPLLKDAQQLPDQEILSEPSHVIQVKITGKEWIEQSSSPLFKDLKSRISSQAALDHILENTVVKMTMWIGKEDKYLHQYSTWIVMPLPGAGYFDQETNFRFYRFGDPAILDKIKRPDEVEKWVLETEE
jgi:hypothetical protein